MKLEAASYVAEDELFRDFFNTEKYPPKSRIKTWINNFDQYGTVKKVDKSQPEKITQGGLKSAQLKLLRRSKSPVNKSPLISLRKRSQAMGLTTTTLWRLIKLDIHLLLYKIQTLHSTHILSPNRLIVAAQNYKNITRHPLDNVSIANKKAYTATKISRYNQNIRIVNSAMSTWCNIHIKQATLYKI